MKIRFAKSFSTRSKSDCLIIPFVNEKNNVKVVSKLKKLSSSIELPIELKDFSGKKGEVLFIYVNNDKENRLLFLGLGDDEITFDNIRYAYGEAIKACIEKKLKRISILLPEIENCDEDKLLLASIEGVLLSNYVFSKLKSEEKKYPLENLCVISANKINRKIVDRVKTISTGVYFARDLINNNADEETPAHLASVAKSLSKISSKLTVNVFDKKWIAKQDMGLVLAVSKGSNNSPYFVVAKYKGNPSSKDHTVFVGKGVTYDTGGLSLKPSTGMEDMKTDMSGAATILSTLYTVAKLDMKVNVTVVFPAVENAIGPNSYKPGDVYESYDGKTVEVVNTDAEGRLILADALSYAIDNLSPTRIVNVASLTGAVSIALGDEVAGLMASDDELAMRLEHASGETGEYIWRLPLFFEYLKTLKSDIADIKNVGKRKGATIISALFLNEFVKKSKVPWAHLDIGGTNYTLQKKGYYPKYATGFGVRLLIEFLEGIISDFS